MTCSIPPDLDYELYSELDEEPDTVKPSPTENQNSDCVIMNGILANNGVENEGSCRKRITFTSQEKMEPFSEQVAASEEQEKLILEEIFDDDNKIVKPKKIGVFEFVWLELTRGYSLQNEQDRFTEKRRKVYAFLRIPIELEKFLFYGFIQCLEAFCHIFTFLPVRIVMNLFGCCLRLKSWSAADTCDILKVLIILCSSCVMQLVDTSMIYHLVRGQGVIKLYIFYNMLEVADKLFSSFGQDIFDALIWTASERGGKRRVLSTLFHLMVTIVYAICHTVLVLLQATTLNVAFNSHNQSLLTIMMSNNFVELKGSVFKKFAKPNLFQMSCSDCRERFHILILLVIVVLRNMTALNWKLEHLAEMLPDLIMIVIAELLVDWLKHAFITKFNEIPAIVYRDFTITLAFDVLRSHEKNGCSDFSDQVSRRMGFIPIPISILLIRIIMQSIDISDGLSIAILIGILFTLFATKVLCGCYLHGKAVDMIIEFQAQQDAEHGYDEEDEDDVKHRRQRFLSRSVPNSPRLSVYDFTDVLTQAATRKTSLKTVPFLQLGYNSFGLRYRRRRNERETNDEKPAPDGNTTPPRRSLSMVNFVNEQKTRSADASPPSPSRIHCATTTDAQNSDIASSGPNSNESSKQNSRRRQRVVLASPGSPISDLDDVQAYQLLNSSSTASLVTTNEDGGSVSRTRTTSTSNNKLDN